MIRLHDTATRGKRAFEPTDPQRVTLYVCGPTVYSFAHIGNARPAIVFDVLFRLLRHAYGEEHVIYARNITDVDDKIMLKAKEEGVGIGVITERYARIYREDMAAVGNLSPSLEPTVTGTMKEIVAMIQTLVERGHAYAAEGHVLFSVNSFESYGELSGRSLEEMQAGARVEVAPYKKDPGDFVLWKPSSDTQPGWESPWGRGRPGWHIECSAMIEKHLGETIDIHGGGSDLKFPHHENERAQSMCAHGDVPFARFWMHNGFLEIESEKMSKSIGNVSLVHELVEEWPGEALRYTMLTAHYRQPLNWTRDTVTQSKKNLDRLYRTLAEATEVSEVEAGPSPVVLEALEDDLNTPRALAELNELAKTVRSGPDAASRAEAKAQLLASGRLMGLLVEAPEAWLAAAEAESQSGVGGDEAARIDALIVERAEARKARNFARSDEIRDNLLAEGIELVDGADGTTWRRKS